MSAARPSRNYFAFEISDDLHNKTVQVVRAIRAEEDKSKAIPPLIDMMGDAIDAGLTHFLLYPLELAGVSAISRNAVKVAIRSAKRTIMVVAIRITKSLNDEQLLSIADFLDETLLELEEPV
ncbi:MAG: hypothetical protein M9941_09610 [Anaerolineae bacterium]|nr:hypothetical protein [Anaerolineae bacterium]MCO5191249.1 hypothetical protein [Anaerolineae bacterium]MCO5193876.1 hypothetical protein [Anaerolineae bacterium]MCO5197983.1 hypothetical protein [Anaerolineae bacterium]